ncbi:hypothetical protein BC828DRAFT_411977 [Blastocladiella britannica]|nr:hypothetical protein BC828DRAFT_411977 [Blastocladiella britannica]
MYGNALTWEVILCIFLFERRYQRTDPEEKKSMIMSLLSHDMHACDPYETDNTSPNPSVRTRTAARRANPALDNDPFKHHYKPALTKTMMTTPAGRPTPLLPSHAVEMSAQRRVDREGQMHAYNFDGTSRDPAPAPVRQPTGRSTRPQEEDNVFFFGQSRSAAKPRPRQSMDLPDMRADEKVQARQELAQYEKIQLQELAERRRSERSNAGSPQGYFPFGRDRPTGRIRHSTDDRRPMPPPEEQAAIASGFNRQIRERGERAMVDRELDGRPDVGFFPRSSVPNARIACGISDPRSWQGPSSELHMGTGGGGAPVYDVSTGAVRTSLPLPPDDSVRNALAMHNPGRAAQQARYAAALDSQRVYEPQLPETIHGVFPLHHGAAESVDPDKRYPLTGGARDEQRAPWSTEDDGASKPKGRGHRAIVDLDRRGDGRPHGFDLPTATRSLPQTLPEPGQECFFNGERASSRPAHGRRKNADFEPAPASNPVHHAHGTTDIANYRDAVIRDAPGHDSGNYRGT